MKKKLKKNYFLLIFLLLIPFAIYSINSMKFSAISPLDSSVDIILDGIYYRGEYHKINNGRFFEHTGYYITSSWWIDFYTPAIRVEMGGGELKFVENRTMEFENGNYTVSLYTYTFYVAVTTWAHYSSAQNPQQATRGEVIIQPIWKAKVVYGNCTIANIKRGRIINYTVGTVPTDTGFGITDHVDQEGLLAITANTQCALHVGNKPVNPRGRLEEVFSAFMELWATETSITIAPAHRHSSHIFDTCFNIRTAPTAVCYEIIVAIFTYQYVPKEGAGREPVNVLIGREKRYDNFLLYAIIGIIGLIVVAVIIHEILKPKMVSIKA